MDILCCVCTKSFSLSLSNLRELNNYAYGMVFCSPACFSLYIKRRVSALKSFGVSTERQQRKVSLSDAGEAEYAVWSDTLRMAFRSDFERVVALYLRKMHHEFWYEKISIRVGTKTYTPDFYLPEAYCFIEVKGIWGPGSKLKYKKAAESLDYLKSLVLFPMWMKSLFAREVGR